MEARTLRHLRSFAVAGLSILLFASCGQSGTAVTQGKPLTSAEDSGSAVVVDVTSDVGGGVVDAGGAAVDAGGGVVDAGGGAVDAGSAAVDAGGGVVDAGGDDGGGKPVVVDPKAPMCSVENPYGQPFDDKANGSEPFEAVGDFTVPTLAGDWNFKWNWTGCDSYVFLVYHPDTKYALAQQLWKSASKLVFNYATQNVHIFFMSYNPDASAIASEVSALKQEMDAALAGQSKTTAAHWKYRLHYVTANAFQLPNWIGATLKNKGVFYFGIDRLQRRRQFGLLKMPLSNSPYSLSFTNYETRYFNYEWQRQQTAKTLDKADVVTLYDYMEVQSGWGGKSFYTEVTLPSADKMKTFDTMALDLTLGCKDDRDENCPEWDRDVYMYVCEQPLAAELPAVVTACTAKTDKMACDCSVPGGGTAKRERVCNDKGTGYGACKCGCGIEFARQITAYRRRGRWWTDISPLLPLVANGGKQKFRYVTVDKYYLTAKLHLANQGKKTRPFAIVALYKGAQFNEKYNSKFKAKKIAVPAGTKKAYISALITGHGSGTDSENCAEFCNHTHHFSVGGKTVVKSHAKAKTSSGCANEVKSGVVPNQYGTWPYGRAGWCPGQDVKLWNADISDAIEVGKDAEFTYKALFKGKVYVPKWSGTGSYKPVIKMTSWVVFEK